MFQVHRCKSQNHQKISKTIQSNHLPTTTISSLNRVSLAAHAYVLLLVSSELIHRCSFWYQRGEEDQLETQHCTSALAVQHVHLELGIPASALGASCQVQHVHQQEQLSPKMEASVPVLMLYKKYNTGVLKHSEPEFPVLLAMLL